MATKTYPEVNDLNQAVEAEAAMNVGTNDNTLKISGNFFSIKDNKQKHLNKNNNKTPKQKKEEVRLQPEDVMMDTMYRDPELLEAENANTSGNYSKFCFVRKAAFKSLVVPNIKEFGWSPDGKYIVIPSEEKKHELLILDIEASTNDKPVVFKRLSGYHTDRITATAWSPNGNNIASVGYDGKVILYNAATWTKTQERTVGQGFGHRKRSCDYVHPLQSYVASLKWSNDNSVLATCGPDNRVFLWEGLSLTMIKILSAYKDTVVDMDFTFDSVLFVSGCKDGSVWCHYSSSGQKKWKIPPSQLQLGPILSVSAKGWCINADAERTSSYTLAVIGGHSMDEIILIDGTSGAFVRKISIGQGFRALRTGWWNVGGTLKTLFSAEYPHIYQDSRDTTKEIQFNKSSGIESLQQLDDYNLPFNYLLTGSGDYKITLWDPTRLTDMENFSSAPSKHVGSHPSWVTCLQAAPEGANQKKMIASVCQSGNLYIWELLTPTDNSRFEELERLMMEKEEWRMRLCNERVRKGNKLSRLRKLKMSPTGSVGSTMSNSSAKSKGMGSLYNMLKKSPSNKFFTPSSSTPSSPFANEKPIIEASFSPQAVNEKPSTADSVFDAPLQNAGNDSFEEEPGAESSDDELFIEQLIAEKDQVISVKDSEIVSLQAEVNSLRKDLEAEKKKATLKRSNTSLLAAENEAVPPPKTCCQIS